MPAAVPPPDEASTAATANDALEMADDAISSTDRACSSAALAARVDSGVGCGGDSDNWSGSGGGCCCCCWRATSSRDGAVASCVTTSEGDGDAPKGVVVSGSVREAGPGVLLDIIDSVGVCSWRGGMLSWCSEPSRSESVVWQQLSMGQWVAKNAPTIMLIPAILARLL